MSREAKAMVRWVPASRGGRQAPPVSAAGYCAPARFEDDPGESLGMWSVRILGAIEILGAELIDAQVKFLFDEAPHDLLKEGARFELMEGKEVAAKCVVLPNSIEVPSQIDEFELALLG